MIYVNKLLLLDQDVLVRICGTLQDDKMLKNSFENVHREDAEEVDRGKCGRMVMKIC